MNDEVESPHLVVNMVSGGGIKPDDEVSFQPADGYSKDEWNELDDELDGWWLHDIYPNEKYPSREYQSGTLLGTITFDSPSDDDPTFDWIVSPVK